MASEVLLQRSYRAKIKQIVEDRIASGEDLSFSKLSTATRIQRTFLSQAMNLKQHLNNDQLYAIALALKFPSDLREHLILLSEWERCKLPARKASLEAKLRILEEPLLAKSMQNRITGTRPDAWDDYFCDPQAEVVFRFLSIERYRLDPQLIRERLGLSAKRWQEIIQTLLDCQLIENRKNLFHPIKSGMFAQDQSPEGKIRHIMGRLKVSEQKLKQRNIDEFLYNWSIMSNSRAKKQLKIEYLHLIERIYRESQEVVAEDVYQLSIDLLNA